MAADGTAWALRIIAGPVPQLGALTPWFPTREEEQSHTRSDGDEG